MSFLGISVLFILWRWPTHCNRAILDVYTRISTCFESIDSSSGTA
jgi:hypothetical protein